MTEEEYSSKIRELCARLADLRPEQRAALEPLVEETRRRHVQIQSDVDAARDAVATWSLLLKYALFELEARERERAEGED